MDPANSALLCTVQKALGALCALLLFGRPAGLLDVASQTAGPAGETAAGQPAHVPERLHRHRQGA